MSNSKQNKLKYLNFYIDNKIYIIIPFEKNLKKLKSKIIKEKSGKKINFKVTKNKKILRGVNEILSNWWLWIHRLKSC